MANVKDPKLSNVISKLSNLTAEEKDSPINQFINRLITEKKFPELDEKVQKILKDDLMRRLNDFITLRTIAALTDNDILALNKMLDEKKPAPELQKFISDHIADYTNFLTATLLEFREVYLGLNPPTDVATAENEPMPPAPVAPPMPAPPSVMLRKNEDVLRKMN